jgi:hypothetical protein
MIMPDPWGFGVGLGFLLVGAAVGRVRDRRHPLPPDRLRCEYLINPLGVDVRRPRFFWVPRSERREERQSAYRIVVAASPNDSRNVLWDSGKVKSGRFTQVEYEGRALASGTTYYWKVRWWDRDGASSPWSDPGTFDTGFCEGRLEGPLDRRGESASPGIRDRRGDPPGSRLCLRFGVSRTPDQRPESRIFRAGSGVDLHRQARPLHRSRHRTSFTAGGQRGRCSARPRMVRRSRPSPAN